MPLGPFDVPADRVANLGVAFTEVVNRLLEAEAAASGLAGHRLSLNVIESIPDKGVDAAIRGARSSDWIPYGDSAWQFKRGKLGPKGCAKEFANATWAQEFLRNGGVYVVVLGRPLPDHLIQSRRRAIVAAAVDLGLITRDEDDRVRVYEANALARWISRYVPLAVSPVIGGPGAAAIDYETWARRRAHTRTKWVADAPREQAVQLIRERVAAPGVVELRVQGNSGIGKSRLVLEALADDTLRPLVAYVHDESALSNELLSHIGDGTRSVVLVVDDCPADRHIKVVERLPDDPSIRLITIGRGGSPASSTPVIGVDELPDDDLDEVLQSAYPLFGPERRRFVTSIGRGNMRLALVVADRVAEMPDAQAADLIARDDVEGFLSEVLPEGAALAASTWLAVFTRIGWDGELRGQLELLADFSGVSVEHFEEAGRDLARRGLLTQHGRLRSVEPHPVAIYLAAEAWRQGSDRIIEDLLPRLDEQMALALFERVADLGRFEPARSVLSKLLTDQPFASLHQLEESTSSRFLKQVAIVLPDELALHLAELIEAEPLESLKALTRSRRELVWTLEKLVWHSRTFETSADALLRLARSETETYANNATGVWISLFATLLPATAASPAQRLRYLRRLASSGDAEVQRLAASAAAKGLERLESVSVSGELQAGVLVEPRGTPATRGEAADYRKGLIELLWGMSRVSDSEVAEHAEDQLIGALHPLGDDPLVADALFDALTRLSDRGLERVRSDVERLISLHDRHRRGDRNLVERLEGLRTRLPEATPEEDLRALAHVQRWDLEDGELSSRLEEAVGRITPNELDAIRALLREDDLPAAWELGGALAIARGDSPESLDLLVDAVDRNPMALVGYLNALAGLGNQASVDKFFQGQGTTRLDLRLQVMAAVRVPVSEVTRRVILSGLRKLSVAGGANALFGWQKNLSDEEKGTQLQDWLSRVQTQLDYNALVDTVHLWLYKTEGTPGWLEPHLKDVVMLRRDFPEVRQQAWDWSQLSDLLVNDAPLTVARLIFDLVDDDALLLYPSDEEARLLLSCAGQDPRRVWEELVRRLERDSWRLQISIRGWLIDAFPIDVIADWIGRDLDRARIAAAAAPVGGSEPSQLVRLLLSEFGDDEDVRSGLAATYLSGTWTGPESARLAAKVEELTTWRRRRGESAGVRSWAKWMVEGMSASRGAALQREAERGW